MKVLLVDPNAERAAALAQALGGKAVDVATAPSGSFALTMLEWNTQDAVVSRARLGDMDGHELCAILRSDPSTKDIRFVLVVGPGENMPAQTAAAGVDLLLPDALSNATMVSRVVHLLQRQLDVDTPIAPAAAPRLGRTPAPSPAVLAPPVPASAAAPPPTPPASVVEANTDVVPAPVAAPPPTPVVAEPGVPIATPAATPVASEPVTPVASEPVTAVAPEPVAPIAREPVTAVTTEPARVVPPSAPAPAAMAGLDTVGTNGAARTFQGALGVLEIEELTQAIAVGGKTGRLVIVLSTGGGLIVFEAGRVTHAEFSGQIGETAFGALVAASHRERGGKFCFIPVHRNELRSQPKTIDRGVDQLLLDVAKTMDEERRA
jgi:CheY-like chemotaxis protein